MPDILRGVVVDGVPTSFSCCCCWRALIIASDGGRLRCKSPVDLPFDADRMYEHEAGTKGRLQSPEPPLLLTLADADSEAIRLAIDGECAATVDTATLFVNLTEWLMGDRNDNRLHLRYLLLDEYATASLA